MFTETAGLYDAIYGKLKDYADEARQIAELIRAAQPAAQTVLDVACGTGEHARLLTAQGFAVDGVDLNSAFVEIARHKLPAARFEIADMVQFELGRSYDVVLSLFSAIGYADTVPRLRAAIACLARHVAPGGVVLVEPWITPEDFGDGRSGSIELEVGDLRVTRRHRSSRDGNLSTLRFDYDITGPDGTRHASEVHTLGLFSVDEMHAAFDAAGLRATLDPVGGPAHRGLYTARLA